MHPAHAVQNALEVTFGLTEWDSCRITHTVSVRVLCAVGAASVLTTPGS